MRRILVLIIFGVILLLGACSKELTKGSISPNDQFQRAMALHEKGDYLKAQGEFQTLIYSSPGLTFIDTAQYYLAMTYFNIKSYPEAIGEFKKLLQTYPSSALADDAQFNLALAHYKESPKFALDQTETYAAIDEYGIFLDRYADSPLAAEAQKNLDILYDKLAKKLFKSGELYLKLRNYEPALLYFEQVRDNYPSTEWAQLAMYYTGVAQMKMGRKPEAIETFQNYILAFPEHKLIPKAQKNIIKLGIVSAGD